MTFTLVISKPKDINIYMLLNDVQLQELKSNDMMHDGVKWEIVTD